MNPADTRRSELRDQMRLNLVPGVGPRLQQLLLERFDTPAGVFAATREELLSVSGVGKKLVEALVASDTAENAELEIERCEELGVQLLR